MTVRLLMKAVMWTDLSVLCNSCRCVNIKDVLTTQASSYLCQQSSRVYFVKEGRPEATRTGDMSATGCQLSTLLV